MKFFKDNALILEFMAINICTGIWVGMVNFIIPIYALSLNATSTEIGLIRGLSSIGDLLLVLPAGLMIDYFGSRKVYPVSCVLGAIITILLSLAGTPFILIVMMVFYGMARSFRNTSLNASFFKYMPLIGIKKGGWYKASMSIGASFLGAMVGGLVAVAVSFAGYFILSSAFLLMPLTISLRRGHTRAASKIKVKKMELTDSLRYYRGLVKNRVLFQASITELFNSALFITFMTFVTVLAVKDLSLSVAMAAALLSVRGLANIFVEFFGGRLLEFNYSYLYCISFFMSALALLVFGFSRDATVLMLASVVIGAFSGLMSIVTFAQVGGIEGEKGKISSVFTFWQKIGMVLGPVLGGIVGDWWGIQAIFLFFIPFFLAMAFLNLAEGQRAGLGSATGV